MLIDNVFPMDSDKGLRVELTLQFMECFPDQLLLSFIEIHRDIIPLRFKVFHICRCNEVCFILYPYLYPGQVIRFFVGPLCYSKLKKSK